MTTKQVDPSTGKRLFLNPELGGANEKVTMYYWDLVDLAKKYKLPSPKEGILSQSVVDYWVSSYYKRLADSFAKSRGVNAAKAQNASAVLQSNIDALSDTIPQEIRTYVDEMLDKKIYQQWYHAQNEYGMSKHLLDKQRTLSYEGNQIWQENGYMPIKVQQETSGHWIQDDGRIDAVIEQDWEALTFNVAEGQHYVDPELVRQLRLRKMAQAEVSSELFKAYKGFTNSATNIVQITGSETAYVNTVKSNMTSLDTAIEDSAKTVFGESFGVEPQVGKGRKFVKNEVVPEETRTNVVAGMSPSQTADFLVQKRVLDGPSGKLTDKVTAENYEEWFNQQSVPVKKYLMQQYSEYGDGLEVNAREAIRTWSQEEWYAYEDLLQTVGRMASTADALGTGKGKLYWDIYEQVRNMAVRTPYKDAVPIAAIKNSILKELDYYNLPKSMIENIDVSSARFTKATDADYPGWDVNGRSGQASEMFRMLDESNPNATAEGSLRDYYRDWKGKELAVIEMPTSAYMDEIGEYGNYTMRQSINADGRVDEYVKRFENGERAPITYITYGENGKISGQEGRHRAIAANRAGIEKMPVVIEYAKGTHPEILDKYKDVTERFVKRADDYTETNSRVIKEPYKLEDIKSGKVSDVTRAKLAYRVVEDEYKQNITDELGAVYHRIQPKGKMDGIYGDPASVTNNAFKGDGRVKISGDGAYQVYTDGPYLYHKRALLNSDNQRLFFPVRNSDILKSSDYNLINSAAKGILDTPKKQRAEVLKNFDIPGVDKDIVKKIVSADDAMLKRLADNDVRAYAEISGKKVINTFIHDADGDPYWPGSFVFPDLNPELVQDGLKSMSKITGELESRGTMSQATRRNHNKKRLQELIDSQENVDFLNRIGWNKGIGHTSLRGRAGDYDANRYSGYERIRMNLNSIDDIKFLQTVELHELSHAAWLRASAETRKAIGQDLLNKMGLKLTVSNWMACSRDMNELIAHCVDRRFSSSKGWNSIKFKDDKTVQKHLSNLAKHAGVKLTEDFKERAILLVRSFITFIKTKLLGINSAKTFDEYYQGLLRGDFADDLKKNLTEFSDLSSPNLSLPLRRSLETVDAPDNLRKIPVEGGDEGYDVPVNITQGQSDKTPAEIIEGLNIPIKDKSSPAESIFVDTGQPNNFALLQKAIADGGDDFEAGLQRAYLAGDANFSKTSVMNEAAKNIADGKDAFYQGVIMAKIKGETKNINKLNVDAFWDDMLETIKKQVDNYVGRVSSNSRG